MKRAFLVIITLLVVQCTGFCVEAGNTQPTVTVVYSQNDKYGLKSQQGEEITSAEYQKLIRLGENGVWLFQKKSRFGLMDNNGNIIVKPKYRQAERIFGKYAKLGNDKDWGLYDENGNNIIPQEYASIDPLFGKMFLTKKNYKYGIINIEGKKLLNNDFEDIYMPNPQTVRVKYYGEWFDIEKVADKDIELPSDVETVTINDNQFTIKRAMVSTCAASGYSLVTVTDYAIKLLSSISPAYEETIDELMLSKGAETVSIFVKLSWLPKFPFTYMKKYYQNFINPNNGPLNNLKSNLKKNI